MGSSQSFKKDPNVFIYMELQKQIYRAGQLVEGNVYLDVKSHSTYDALYVRLEGKQYCYWSEGSGKHRRTYSNSRDSYLEQFIIHKFDSGVVALGQYIFPFSFILPNSMSGSFEYSGSNYIRYNLISSLNSFQKVNDNQLFVANLTINQNLKVPYGAISRSNSVRSQCCGCCMKYGTTTVHLSCDRNFAMTGDVLNIKARIDHSQGQSDIDNVTINLIQHKIMVSSGGHGNCRGTETFTLLNFREKYGNKRIMKGQTEDTAVSAMVPTSIQRSTAIGNVTAIWFQIQAYCELGYCNYSPPQCAMQIVIHSRNPILSLPPKVNPPADWRPLSAPKVFYNSMKPYLHQPVAQIMSLNTAVVVPQGNMGGNMEMGNMVGIIPNFNQNLNQNNQTNFEFNNKDPYEDKNYNQEFKIL